MNGENGIVALYQYGIVIAAYFNEPCSIIVSIVNKEGELGSLQTSKEQTKMPRFRFEGPRPSKSFCFTLIHYA